MKIGPFSPHEVGAAGPVLLPVARRLEEYASEASPAPSAELADRIWMSIAREPAPTPPVLLVRALRNGSFTAAANYLAQSLQAAIGVRRSFPIAVRAQAIAVVLTAVIVLGGGGAALAAGAVGVVRALVPAIASELAPTAKQWRPIAHGMSHGKKVRQHGVKPDKDKDTGKGKAKGPRKSPQNSPQKRSRAAIDQRGSDDAASNAASRGKTKPSAPANHPGG
jgi:hypothetical protein